MGPSVGETVRITAQRVNAADGSTLWLEQSNRPYKDLFELQDEITRAIAGALKARLLSDAAAVVDKLGFAMPATSPLDGRTIEAMAR